MNTTPEQRIQKARAMLEDSKLLLRVGELRDREKIDARLKATHVTEDAFKFHVVQLSRHNKSTEPYFTAIFDGDVKLGRQLMAYININDEANNIFKALENEARGKTLGKRPSTDSKLGVHLTELLEQGARIKPYMAKIIVNSYINNLCEYLGFSSAQTSRYP